MWIQRGNLNSRLTRSTDAERAWLIEYLTFRGKQISAAEPKALCLFNVFANSYPAGFDALIRKAAVADGQDVQFLDSRVAPCEVDPNADLAWLRDYQLEAVQRIITRKRGILWLPTGAGKTEIIVALTRALPCKWLALVHRSQLADDIAARFEKRSIGLVAGRVLEGKWEVPDDAMLVSATYQSLCAALKKPPTHPDHVKTLALLYGAEAIAVDECHTAPAETFNAILMKTKRAYYRVGLSGTPLARGDAKSQHAIAALGPVVHRIRAEVLIQAGVLARPTVRMVTLDQDSACPTWTGVYGALIARSARRNAVVIGMTKRATKPAFVFIEQVEHGRLLVKQLFQAGMKAEFVFGTHSLDYRKSLIKRLVQGHFDVIVCSRVFNEGIDVPELRACVNAGGMKSIIATLQRLGRGMRVDRKADGSVQEGGDKFEVWDVLDTGNKWTEKHARIRQSAYSNEGYETFVEPAPLTLPPRARHLSTSSDPQ